MSLWSRNELRIALFPEHVGLLRASSKLTLRGYRRRVHDNAIVPCGIAADGEMPWCNAVRTLEQALPPVSGHKPEVEVILSNHFMHYVLVPWMDGLSDAEEMVLARHRFGEMYGSAADTWSVRVSPGRAGVATLASAVDTRLLEELRGSLGRIGLDARSIQPHLMAACNSCRESLKGRDAWVALLEPGNLCLAVLQKGQLVWIRKLRIGDAWREELSTALERETYLADAAAETDEVLLWAPHLEDRDITAVGRWQIRHLHPGTDPVHVPQDGGLHNLRRGYR